MSAPAHLPSAVATDWDRLGQPTPSPERFDPAGLGQFPPAVERWLRHAISPGSALRRRARLSMHGSIKVRRWMQFTAQQVLAPDGFVWAADAGRFPLRIRGFDRFSNETGEMRWKLAGVVPVMGAENADISRSAAGRLAGETMLVPPAALHERVLWHHVDEQHATATITTGELTHHVTVRIDDDGALRAVTLPRWGDPDGSGFGEHLFGVEMDRERRVDGCLVPTRLRAGWWHGTDRWTEGEFFRAELDDVRLL